MYVCRLRFEYKNEIKNPVASNIHTYIVLDIYSYYINNNYTIRQFVVNNNNNLHKIISLLILNEHTD